METQRTHEERLKGSILMLQYFSEKYMATYKPGIEKYIVLMDALSDLIMMENARINAIINCDETTNINSCVSTIKMKIINELSKGI